MKLGSKGILASILNTATKTVLLSVFVPLFIVGTHSQESSAVSTNPEYFPAEAFDVHIRAIKNKWYSTTLRALQEPSLFASRNDKSLQVYRFLWLPSFQRPISVRLTVGPDGSGSIVTRSVDRHTSLLGKVPADTGKLIFDKKIAIGAGDVEKVLQELQRLAFWSMPTEAEEQFGADGSRWIVEGVRSGEYHLVDRWSPDGDSYSALCKHLLRLADVEAKLDD